MSSHKEEWDVVMYPMHQEVQRLCEVEIQHRVEVVPEVEEVVGQEHSDTRHKGMLGLNHISVG
jgi:hypothetical protein